MDETTNDTQNTTPEVTEPVQPKTTIKKTLSYEDKVIKKIAGLATENVAGVIPLSGGFIGSITDKFRDVNDKTKGIEAEIGESQVALDLNVICEYGKNIPDVFEELAVQITQAVDKMTDLKVVELNMHVADILSPESFAALKKNRKKEEILPVVEAEEPAENAESFSRVD